MLILLLIAYSIWFWVFYTLPLHDYNMAMFFDHDIGYLVERLLIYSDYPGIQLADSGAIDYGSELIYYSWFLRFFNQSWSPIAYYWTAQFIHWAAVIGSFVLISKMFEPLRLRLFSIAMLASSLFLFSSFFIKPDSNILLFLVLAAIYFLNRPQNKRNFILFWCIAGIGTSIKWWGWFLIFPYLACLSPTKRRFHFFVLILFLTLSFLSIQHLGHLGDYEASFLKHATFSPEKQEKFSSFVLAYSSHRPLFWGVFIAFFAALSGFSIFCYPFLKGRLQTCVFAFFSMLSGYLLFNLPYLQTKMFFNSVYMWKEYVGPTTPGISFWGWFEEYTQLGIFSPAILIAAVLLWMNRKQLKITPVMKSVLLFAGGMIITLFIFVRRNNYVSGSLFYFMIVLAMIGIVNLSTKKSKQIAAGLIALQLAWMNIIYPYFSLSDFFAMPTRNKEAAIAIEAQLEQKLGTEKVFTCQRVAPLFHRPYTPGTLSDCVSAPFLSQMQRGDVLIENADSKAALGGRTSFQKKDVISGVKYDRFGKRVDLNLQLWKKR